MRLLRLFTAVLVVFALAGVSTWIMAAGARGPTPPGRYEPGDRPSWHFVGPEADALRLDALRRAALRVQTPWQWRDEETLTCRFLSEAPTGTSSKFTCVMDGGEVVKVKYGRNPEIHAEAAATRLLHALGYPADHVTIVPRLRCYGCPRFPFVTLQILSLVRAEGLIGPNGFENGFTDFAWVSAERRFPAGTIRTDEQEGWAWWEMKYSSEPAAELDALRLLAVFLAHWDNKADNQRLVCLDDAPAAANTPCTRPVALIQDLGATFGPTKVNLGEWRAQPVWTDRATCTVSMEALPFHGSTFSEARIAEDGRALLARRLSQLTDEDITRLFADARFPQFHSATDDARDLAAWTAAFRHRRDQIVSAGPCPGPDRT